MTTASAAELRTQILNARDLKSELITVPEWNGAKVQVCVMTGLERDEFETFLTDAPESGRSLSEIMGKLITLTLRDEAGVLIFGEGDVKELAKKNANVLKALYEAAVRMNQIGFKHVEAEAGKSEGVHGGSSASASPSTSA